MRIPFVAAAGVLLLLAGCGQTSAQVEERHHILVAGSSTVYPFTKAVADRFRVANGQLAPPVVQSTGTGAGILLFCAGTGGTHPDVVGASRRMHAAEMETCRRNGIAHVTELQIGVDGLAFVQSPAAPEIRLTRHQVYEALAATPFGQTNARRTWREIDPSLPDIPILIYGPPNSSGTQESLRDLIMVPGCESDPGMRRLKEQDEGRFDAICTSIRADGAYVGAGEDDERTVVQLVVNPGAVGIFGFSYLERHASQLRGIPVDGVEPTEEAIASGRYSGARPLFIYVKTDQVEQVPGLRAFLAEYAGAIAPGGYLEQRGLVPATDAVRAETTRIATSLTPLDARSLR